MGNTQKTPAELQEALKIAKEKAEAKVLADAKVAEDKKEADAKKVVEAKKEADAKVAEAKVLADAKVVEDKKEADAKLLSESKKIVLKNTSGKEVLKSAYFYKGIVPPGFEGSCGQPVDREDLLSVFNKVFKPSDNILFYKQSDKEVYIVIIPIKYSVEIGEYNDSLDGDFQKHAISFLNEGSVNVDTLRQKLEKVKKFVKYDDR